MRGSDISTSPCAVWHMNRVALCGCKVKTVLVHLPRDLYGRVTRRFVSYSTQTCGPNNVKLVARDDYHRSSTYSNTITYSLVGRGYFDEVMPSSFFKFCILQHSGKVFHFSIESIYICEQPV